MSSSADDLLRAWMRSAATGGDGSEQAFERLVRATQADVWRYCCRMTDRQRADDLTQETFLRAWSSIASYRGDASPRAWVLGVARHVVGDHVRRRARRARLASITPFSSVGPSTRGAAEPVSRAAGPGDALATEELFGTLDADRREAFVLTQFLGLSYAEAAEACDVPIGTIRSRVARARESLIAVTAAANTA